MKYLIALSFLLAVPASVGCSRSSSAAQADRLYGRVDTSLPPELQAKQEAVRKLFVGLQTGTIVTGVTARGRFEKLLDDVTRAVRWEFDGVPHGNEVPVVLYFQAPADGKDGSKTEQPVKRVYFVSGSGDRFTVARK
jgi:hypothetical protein